MLHARPRTPRAATVVLVVALAALLTPWAAAPAVAEPRLEMTPAEGLDPDGQLVTVRGSGYDENKGIYVAWCVVPAPGEKPSPCGGGEDRSGSSGNSVWISSNPPMYGLGLAEGYEEGGTFEVEIVVSRWIEAEDGTVDCFEVACAVTTRADHERSSDRSQDAFGAVSFAGQDEPTSAPTAPTTPSASPTTSPTTADSTPRPSSTAPSSSAAATPEPSAEQATTTTDTGVEADDVVPSATPRVSESDLPTLGGAASEPPAEDGASAASDGAPEAVAVELDQGGRSAWIVLAAVGLVLAAAVATTRTWRSR